MQSFLTALAEPANFAGHVSYMLLIASMMMRKMVWLRLLAIAAGLFSAGFYYFQAVPVSFFWEVVFVLVNAVQLFILYIENRRGKFSDEEQAFIDNVLSGVERAQARRLMKLGAWTEVSESMVMIEEDTTPPHLIYVVSGSAKVERHGRQIGQVGAGDFLGEMSYLTGKPATATVSSTTTLRYLSFNRTALRAFLDKNVDVRHAMEAGFNRNLVDKLVKTSAVAKTRTRKPAKLAQGKAA
jgi:hypothetical protein